MRHKRRMTGETELPAEQQLAIAYARRHHRDAIDAILRLDRNLGRAVSQANEPIVGQIRLAWWRDALVAPLEARPPGNPVLDAISLVFDSKSERLVALIDGWESLLLAETLTEQSIEPFVHGRSQAWCLAAEHMSSGDLPEVVDASARFWALADLLTGLGDERERSVILSIAERLPEPSRLSRDLRPLSILAALARRAIAQGGVPLLSDRRAALVALRTGLIGR